MRFSSLLAHITAPSIKDLIPQRFRFSWEPEPSRPPSPPSPPPLFSPASLSRRYTSGGSTHSTVRQPAALQDPVNGSEEPRYTRRSRSLRLSRLKSSTNLTLRKRRSWFGGRPCDDEQASSVPTLPPLNGQDAQFLGTVYTEDEITGLGTALTTDEIITWDTPVSPVTDERQKSRQQFFAGRKQPQLMVSRRSSGILSLGDQPNVNDLVPPISVMPVAARGPYGSTTDSVAADGDGLEQSSRTSMRRTLSGSWSKSDASSINRRRRQPPFQHLNPDDIAAEGIGHRYETFLTLPPLPELPPLLCDDSIATPNSTLPQTYSLEATRAADSAVSTYSPIPTVARTYTPKHPRPVSGLSLTAKRRSYDPTNAAIGFWTPTTDGAPSRSSYEYSLFDDGEGSMIRFSKEQPR